MGGVWRIGASGFRRSRLLRKRMLRLASRGFGNREIAFTPCRFGVHALSLRPRPSSPETGRTSTGIGRVRPFRARGLAHRGRPDAHGTPERARATCGAVRPRSRRTDAAGAGARGGRGRSQSDDWRAPRTRAKRPLTRGANGWGEVTRTFGRSARYDTREALDTARYEGMRAIQRQQKVVSRCRFM